MSGSWRCRLIEHTVKARRMSDEVIRGEFGEDADQRTDQTKRRICVPRLDARDGRFRNAGLKSDILNTAGQFCSSNAKRVFHGMHWLHNLQLLVNPKSCIRC